MLNITECPRDAMQSWHTFIPTEVKTDYINQLLKVGFDIIDFGSFVSPKVIPQLKDTAAVLNQLNLANTQTKLLAIIANERGAVDACKFEEISFLGFPLSLSETFQQRNTNSSIAQSLQRIEAIQNRCIKHKKKLVVYLSMAFGNPYGDEWNIDILQKNIHQLYQLGIKIMPLSDIMGTASSSQIKNIFKTIIPEHQHIEFGLHLHTKAADYYNKIEAAYQVGCRKFDTVINGYGGCPRTGKELIGNLNTVDFYNFLIKKNITTKINKTALLKAEIMAQKVFL